MVPMYMKIPVLLTKTGQGGQKQEARLALGLHLLEKRVDDILECLERRGRGQQGWGI